MFQVVNADVKDSFLDLSFTMFLFKRNDTGWAGNVLLKLVVVEIRLISDTKVKLRIINVNNILYTLLIVLFLCLSG